MPSMPGYVSAERGSERMRFDGRAVGEGGRRGEEKHDRAPGRSASRTLRPGHADATPARFEGIDPA